MVRKCSVKKAFLEISQDSQENTCARDSVNFVKFLGTPFLTEHLWCLLLPLVSVFAGIVASETLH